MNKKLAGNIETIFNITYLATAAVMGVILLKGSGPAGVLPGAAALTLAGGDSFHLAPRIAAAITSDRERFHRALGLGKLITSLTMTAFYLMLWHLGLSLGFGASSGWTVFAYSLALLRIVLCLFPQNGWLSKSPSPVWGIWRNIPFALLGLLVAFLFAFYGGASPGLRFMWFAILLSFAFYIPVVLWAHKNPRFGMLMLPKTLAYIWMISMFFSL